MSVVTVHPPSLSGSWIYFTRVRTDPTGTIVTVEVRVVREGELSRVAVEFSHGFVAIGPGDEAAHLRQQFSPDGRELVLSTTSGLEIVDLASGRARPLGVAGAFPSWSKNGSTIAYIAPLSRPDPTVVPPELAIWLVSAAGGTPRELLNVGYAASPPEWSPDGRLLLAQLRDGVGLIDVATGGVISRLPGAAALTGAHWRGGRALVSVIRSDDSAVLLVDRDSAVVLATFERPLNSTACCAQGLVAFDPRWNPVVDDEAVFVLLDERTASSDAKIINTRTGKVITALTGVAQATWSSDGSRILFISGRPGVNGSGVRSWERATGAIRALADGLPQTQEVAVTSVAY